MIMAKKYELIEGTENKYIKYEVDYQKGGMNYYNGATEKRGYYLCVRIVERKPSGTNGLMYESFLMFGGTKKLLVEVARKSDKKYQEAIKLAEQYETELKQYVLSKEKV